MSADTAAAESVVNVPGCQVAQGVADTNGGEGTEKPHSNPLRVTSIALDDSMHMHVLTGTASSGGGGGGGDFLGDGGSLPADFTEAQTEVHPQ